MAVRYAIATGNWSNPAIWNGGLGVPGAGDVVHPEQYIVTLDQDITVAELRNDRGGGTVGGYFIVSGSSNRTVTADLYGMSVATNYLLYAYSTGLVTINGNVYQPPATNQRTIYSNTSVSLIVNGNVIAAGTGTSTYAIHLDGATGSVTINGNVSSQRYCRAVTIASASARVITVTGDCSGLQVTGTYAHTITIGRAVGFQYLDALNATIAAGAVVTVNGVLEVAGQTTLFTIAGTGGTVNITGNITAYIGDAISLSASNVTFNVVGNVSGSATAGYKGMAFTALNTTVNIVGNVQSTAISGAYGIYMAQQIGNLSITGNVTGTAAAQGVFWTSDFHDKSCTITGTINNPFGVALGNATYRSNINVGIIAASSTAGGCTFTSAVGGSITIGGTSGSGMNLIGISGAATVVVNGNLTAGAFNNHHAMTASMTGGSLTINGNVTGGTAVTNSHGLVLSGSNFLTVINGNVTAGQSGGSAGDAASANGGVYMSGGPNISLTVNGDVTPNMSPATGGASCGICLPGPTSGSITVNGIVYAPINQSAPGAFAGIYTANASNYGPYYIREVRGANHPLAGEATYNRFALTAPVSVSLYPLSYFVIGTVQMGVGGVWPVSGRVYLRTSETNNIRLYDSPTGTLQSLGEGGASDYPVNANVRAGTAFNFGSQVGTLAVPPPATVALGIATDNTVGTAAVTQQAIADAVGPLIAAYGS